MTEMYGNPSMGDIKDVYVRHLYGGSLTDRQLRERFDRALTAHDAGVRADQAEKDAQIAENMFVPATTHMALIALDIRRAVALTPTSEETEQ